MPLDGLRAWIGEVERKLGMRTRVFLVLAVIAVGGAGAAIVLAIDAQNSAVSESDVRTLQEQLEARISEGSGSASVTQLETEVKDLQAKLSELQSGSGSGTAGSGSGTAGSGSGTAGSGGQSGSGSGSSSGGSSSGGSANQGTGDTTAGSKSLQEALRRAKEQQK